MSEMPIPPDWLFLEKAILKTGHPQSMTLVNDTLDYTENNAQYVQYGCLVWLGM
jgi:hypothetical protein